MDSLRWGICVLSVGAIVSFSGCAKTFGRWQSPSEYDEQMLQKEQNERQASENIALINERVRLTNLNNDLQAQLGLQGELLAANRKIMDDLQAKIDNFNKTAGPEEAGGITVGKNKYNEVVLSMKGDVLFASGDAKLKPSGEKVLAQAAEMVNKEPNKLAICGFTDSDPIQHSKWSSNFDLSGARALAVLTFLEKEGIKPDRMHYRGYGQYDLVADASGKENKAKSRRAEIVLLNGTDAMSAAPAGTTPRRPTPAPKPPMPMTPK